MTVNTIEFPSDLEILMTREFEAPIELVFDVFTKEEHVRNTFPPFGEEMALCDDRPTRRRGVPLRDGHR